MDKNSTPTTISYSIPEIKPMTMQSPSAASLARIRQFARSYVYFQKANSLGGVILN